MMPIKIRKTSEVKIDGVKGIIYGMAGVGKTMLCATAPKPIIISAEQGLLSLADKDVDFVEVKKINEVHEAYEYFTKSDDHDYETVCLDSLSEIGEVVLAEFKKTEKDGRQAYMKLATALNAMVRNFRDIKGKNVIFTAKLRTIEDEDSGITSYVPSMPGRVMPDALPYLVDIVLPMRVGGKRNEEYRYLQTTADIKYVAKDRSGKLDAKEKPDLGELFKKIKGELK